jgi:hypothetical protein
MVQQARKRQKDDGVKPGNSHETPSDFGLMWPSSLEVDKKMLTQLLKRWAELH